MSGFSAIVLMLLLLVIGYIGYQIGRVQFTYGSISERVTNVTKIGATMSDGEIMQQLLESALEAKTVLDPESVYIDRTIPDSIRIYVAYQDSASIFGIFTYRRHFRIDKIAPTSIR
jgi:hypothetical protein